MKTLWIKILFFWTNLPFQGLTGRNLYDVIAYWSKVKSRCKITNTTFDGVKVRVYRPRDVESDKPLPAVVYMHGGGFRCLSVGMCKLSKQVFTISLLLNDAYYTIPEKTSYPSQSTLWFTELRHRVIRARFSPNTNSVCSLPKYPFSTARNDG